LTGYGQLERFALVHGGNHLAGARVVVTGGAGLVGSAIADQLVELDVAEILILDDFTRGRPVNLEWALANGPVRIMTGDIRDPLNVREAVVGADVVFHQAALRVTQCAEEPRRALEVMMNGTFNVLEAAQLAGVRKIVAASSASVYGEADSFPTAETHHTYNNRTLYGAAKASNEALLRSFHEMYGLNYVALRYFNVYGPRMDIEGRYTEVLVRWMERIDAGLPPIIFGEGSETTDFVYVSDVARANILAATSDVSDEVFNVASGIETSLDQLARMLVEVMGSDLEPHYAPKRAVNSIVRRLGDPLKACSALGFTTEVNLNEGLRRLVAWWKAARSSERPHESPTSLGIAK
jgi:UDP-glucose 4-epimerase